LFGPHLVAFLADERLRSIINDALSSFIAHSNKSNCPLYQESRDGVWGEYYPPVENLIAFFAAGGAVALVATIIVIVVDRRKTLSGSQVPSSGFDAAILVPSPEDADGIASSPHIDVALGFDQRFSLFLRIVPLWLSFLAMAIFLLSFTGTTGWTYLQLTYSDGTEIHFPPQFIFTIPHLVQLFWDSGAHLNAITLVTFSMAWCNVRLVCMICLWFIPPSKISSLHRGRALVIFDYFGKWSLFFFMQALLLPIAFALEIELAPGARVNLYTLGSCSYFLNLCAGLMCVAAGNMMMYAQRCVDEWEAKPVVRTIVAGHSAAVVPDDTKWLPLCRRRFSFEGRPVRLNGLAIFLIVVVLLGSLVLFGFAVVTDNMKYSVMGVAGYILPALGTPADKYRNVWWGTFNYQEVMPEFTFGVLFGQVVVGICTVLVPFVLCLTLLVIFVFPLPLGALLRFVSVVKYLRTWSFWEVMVATLIGNVLSTNACKGINEILRNHFADIVPDGVCYGSLSTPLLGLWLILGSAVLLVMCTQMVVGIAKHASNPEGHDAWKWVRPFISRQLYTEIDRIN
jgi:hypothetical protein